MRIIDQIDVVALDRSSCQMLTYLNGIATLSERFLFVAIFLCLANPSLRLLRAQRVKLLVSVRKIVCRTLKSYLSVCLSMCVPVNNAVRYNLPVLSAI